MNRNPCLCIWVLASIFLFLFISAGVLVSRRFLSDKFGGNGLLDYDAEIDTEFLVTNATAAMLWEQHREIKTQNSLKVYMFHVKNPGVVLEGGKPVLQQVGPFTYEQIRTRTTLGIYGDSDSVRYKDHVLYHFKPEESFGSQTENVTIINMPWVGLAQSVSQLSAFSRFFVTAIVSRYHESVFLTKPVGDLLFGGFYHELIATLGGITGENYMPNNTFGLFYGRNNTFLDPREVNLGLKNHAHFGHTLKWKGLHSMDLWPTHDDEDDDDFFGFDDDETQKDTKSKKDCNKFEGSDWNIFHPNVKKGEELSIFSDEMCRNLKFRFEKEINLEGVKGYRFTIPKEEYEDPRTNSDNKCYCTEPGDGGDMEDCPKDGAYQMNVCSRGASVLLSHPHFYHGHSSYLNQAEGFKPEQDIHQSFIDIEPITGEVLRYSKRVQVNIHLRPLKTFSDFKNVPNMLFPVMWTDESGTIKPEALTSLKTKLRKDSSEIIPSVVRVQNLGTWSVSKLESHPKGQMLLLGVVIIALGILLVLLFTSHKKNKVRIQNQVEEEGTEFSLISKNEQYKASIETTTVS